MCDAGRLTGASLTPPSRAYYDYAREVSLGLDFGDIVSLASPPPSQQQQQSHLASSDASATASLVPGSLALAPGSLVPTNNTAWRLAQPTYNTAEGASHLSHPSASPTCSIACGPSAAESSHSAALAAELSATDFTAVPLSAAVAARSGYAAASLVQGEGDAGGSVTPGWHGGAHGIDDILARRQIVTANPLYDTPAGSPEAVGSVGLPLASHPVACGSLSNSTRSSMASIGGGRDNDGARTHLLCVP